MRFDIKTKWTRSVALSVLLGAGGVRAFAAADAAVDSNSDSNPYAVILQKDVFHLNTPPPPPKPADLSPTLQRPEVALTGLMETGERWKALLVVKSINPDPKGPQLISYLTLAEGGRQSVADGQTQVEIELKQIYPDTGKIDIINMGEAKTLSMNENGVDGQDPDKDVRHTTTGVFRKGRPDSNPAANELPRTPVMFRPGQSARRQRVPTQNETGAAPLIPTQPRPAAVPGNASVADVSNPAGSTASVDSGISESPNAVLVGGGGAGR